MTTRSGTGSGGSMRRKNALAPDCALCQNPCGHNGDYDLEKLWTDNEDIRSLKSLILFGLKGMAASAWHAKVLGFTDESVCHFFYEGLAAVGEDYGMEQLLPLF